MKKLFALVVCGLALTCGGNHPSFAQTTSNQDAISAARENLQVIKMAGQRNIDNLKASAAALISKENPNTPDGQMEIKNIQSRLAYYLKETEAMNLEGLARAEKDLTNALNGHATIKPLIPNAVTPTPKSTQPSYEETWAENQKWSEEANRAAEEEQYALKKQNSLNNNGKIENINQNEMKSLGNNGQLAGIGGGGGTTKQSSGGSGGGWKWH